MAEEGKQEKSNKEREEKQGTDTKEEGVPELKDRLLRLAAEFDNYKKRVAKDIGSARLLGKAELMRSMVPVLDEFELAINAKGLDDEAAKGIELVYSNMIDSLKREGLKPVEVDGKFDPYRHEIVLTRESDEEEGTIIGVVRKGYALGDVLIRPASVIVSKKKEGTR